jgi:hypothetical protein
MINNFDVGDLVSRSNLIGIIVGRRTEESVHHKGSYIVVLEYYVLFGNHGTYMFFPDELASVSYAIN